MPAPWLKMLLMPDPLVICNTSPLLYLNLVDQLDILPALYRIITIPMAVRAELLVGKQQGIIKEVLRQTGEFG